MKTIAIIGGGPASLMLAAQLDTEKFNVSLFEKNKAVGRKFLVAGEGGLNLTYNSSLEELISCYFPSEFLAPIISQFTNAQLIDWFNNIEISTFVGSSNRVFPDLKLKPIEVLNKIVECVMANQVTLQLATKWLGWDEHGYLSFEGFEDSEFDVIVFGLGGASWKVTGSDGEWSNAFEKRGVKVEQFRAANCAFGIDWHKNFITTHRGKPLKNIAMTYDNQLSKGELVITEFGLEGNALYALSQKIQDALLTEKTVTVHMDLKPTMTVDQISTKYKSSQLTKVSDILKEDLNLDRPSIAILKQFTDKETFLNTDLLVEAIKSVPIVLQKADEMDNAISSLGGIALSELDEHFQLKKIPKAYAIGEMLDWYAPTGGYLLQACFSMGAMLAEHLNGQ